MSMICSSQVSLCLFVLSSHSRSTHALVPKESSRQLVLGEGEGIGVCVLAVVFDLRFFFGFSVQFSFFDLGALEYHLIRLLSC